MKRLPLFLAVLIGGISILILSPIIGFLWLLGANEPLNNYIDFLDKSIFFKESE